MQKTLIDVVVTGRAALADDIVAIDLEAIDGGRLPIFEAGAHIEAHIADRLVRPYSLCNAPHERHRYRLGVLRDANSRGGSEAIYQDWIVGHRLKVSQPRNLFPMVEEATQSILVGGGIGITPLISMAHRLDALRRPFQLHYGVRDISRAAFLAELCGSPFADRTHVHFSAHRRFSVAEDVGAPCAGAHLYVCGPQAFMDHVIAEARLLGWADDQIHFEYFDVDIDMVGMPFVVETADGKSFDIPPDRSIADILTENGYDIDISCEKGICGSCILDVVSGTPDHRDHYLTDEEKSRNDCMAVCCSRARSDRLLLKI